MRTIHNLLNIFLRFIFSNIDEPTLLNTTASGVNLFARIVVPIRIGGHVPNRSSGTYTKGAFKTFYRVVHNIIQHVTFQTPVF